MPLTVGEAPPVWTYQDISLYLSDFLVDVGIRAGLYSGKARCLKKNGPEGGRLDFYFEDGASEYRLIVRFGTYERTGDAVVFDLGSMHLYKTAPDAELLMEGYASFSIDFQFCAGDDGGDETATEKGDLLCHDTFDNDGDGKVDCADPNCKKWCP